MDKTKSRRLHLLVSGIIVLVIAGTVGYAYHKPLPPITVSVNPPAGQTAQSVSLPWPTYGQAAVGAVGYGVLATNGSQAPLPTASIAKMMTALAVLQEKPLNLGEQGPILTMTQSDVDSYNKYVAEDGSVVPVSVGEQFSEYQALQAMLLPSANNMAETLARWAFGSIDAYTAYANQYAQTHGWTSMTITDPSGFLPTTMASAHDLTLLGEIAIQNPVIAQIVAQPYAIVPAVGTLHNVNTMLGQTNIIGIKTGNNDQDLGAYLFASTESVGGKTITIVGAIMDAPSLPRAMTDSLPLITAASGNFTAKTIAPSGDKVATYHVPWQGDVAATTASSAKVVAWQGSAVKVSVIPAKLHGKHPRGSDTGVLTVTNSLDTSTRTVTLQLSSAINSPSPWWRLTHIF